MCWRAKSYDVEFINNCVLVNTKMYNHTSHKCSWEVKGLWLQEPNAALRGVDKPWDLRKVFSLSDHPSLKNFIIIIDNIIIILAIGAISIPTINSSVFQRDSHQLYNHANFNFHQLYPTKLRCVCFKGFR